MNPQAGWITFTCPDCGKSCRISETTRAVQHEQGLCRTWAKHKRANDMQGFLRLSLTKAAAGAALFSGADQSSDPAALERLKADLVEEIREGLKKL